MSNICFVRRAIAAGCLISVFSAGYLIIHNGRANQEHRPTRTMALPPLPAGRPHVLRADASIERVTLEEMAARADAIFLGRVVGIGGSETISPSPPAPSGLTRHRVRFAVERTYWGPPVTPVDISLPDLSEASYPLKPGQSYLIFAKSTRLGDLGVEALVPEGYPQGIYERQDDSFAKNDTNGVVNLAGLDRLIRSLRE